MLNSDLAIGTKFLVRWEGYPLDRTTWEPKDSFLQDETLKEVSGIILPFLSNIKTSSSYPNSYSG